MSRHVIIHWPDVTTDRVRWAVSDDTGALDSDVHDGSLADAAASVEGRRATLVLAGDNIVLQQTAVPGGSAARAPTIVRYALEEQLADDVDDLHFALGSKGPGDVFGVAIIDRDVFSDLLERCHDAGLRPLAVVPEMLALPLGERGGWSAWVDGERAVVRLGGHLGFVAETGMAGLMLAGALGDAAAQPVPTDGAAALETDAPTLLLFADSHDSQLEVPEGVEIEHRMTREPLELFAATLVKPPAINLVQGEYSPRREFDRTWRPWRWTAGLAAVLLLVLLAGRALDVRRLGAQEAALDAAIAQAFEQALPGTPMRRPRRQLEQALGSLGSGSGGGFTERFAQVAQSLATQPQTRLNSLSVRGERIDLDLVTDAVPTLDALKQALEASGGPSMEVQSAVADGDGGIRARVRIQ